MSGSDLAPPRRLYPMGVRVMSGVIWALSVGYLGWLAMEEPSALMAAVPAVVLVGTVLFVAFWRPMVVVGDDSVLVRNVLRDIRVPFARLDAITTRFNLTLHVGDDSYAAWGVPAPGVGLGKPRAMDSRSAQAVTFQQSERGVGRASASLGSSSGSAAFVLQHAWERYLLDPSRRAERENPPPVVVRILWWVPAVLGGLLVVTVATILLG